ncbi:hypothetical protein [Burkholderia vietnamiensis]|uniref:hypothetical protein n=1 Tax=Burkholderia vietnamiensis TaxID=60552 RepID=UPI00264D03B5|nr:hypothetical protein [Burkholderia vietnamiensis]MDN8037878.1 hypothetical protein [Burkholderia vietnamiensis]
MLYQLTATAAQMCLPVPTAAAAPEGWLDLLDHWQTLIGATAGGLLGVAGAWIVAGSARGRERRVAAGMVLPDLQQLTGAGMSLAQAAEASPQVANVDPPLRANGRVMFVIRKLAERRPSLFALHTPAIGQLSDIDARLYSHLFQCQMIHRAFEDSMEARRAAYEGAPGRVDDGRARFVSVPTSDTQRYAEWQLCVEHATLANYFLDRFVFSRWPRWCHRVRMAVWPNEFDRRSAALLNCGTLPASGPQTSAAPAAAT